MADGVVSEIEVGWEPEHVPNEGVLYYRVHKTVLDAYGHPIPGAFRNNPPKVPGSGMSTDWGEYSTAVETRRKGPQPAENYAVIRMNVGRVREVPNQVVEHTPDRDRSNRAHTDVFGEKTTEVRAKLMERYEVAIPLSEPAKLPL